MLLTTEYEFPYPEATDDVRVHEDVQDLAEAVDTRLAEEFGIIGHWSRTSDTTAVAGAETGVLRIDNLPCKGGVAYDFYTDTLNLQAISGETGIVRLRISTSGAATTSSTELTYGQGNPNTAFQPLQSFTLCGSYMPSSDVTVSVILTVDLSGGTGNVTLKGAAGAPVRLKCRAVGRFPAASGTTL